MTSEGAHTLRGLHILVVEDEPETLELVSLLLTRAGAEVRSATSAEHALDLLRSAPSRLPDVVVSDLQLPGVDGAAFVRELRRVTGDRVRAIALTANTTPADARRALEAGFDVHLAKPVSADDLVDAVCAVAPSPGPPSIRS